MFGELLEKLKGKRWTRETAEQFLREIEPILDKAGYQAKIVGSVAAKGESDHDLDLLLIASPDDEFDFNIIMDEFPGDFTYEMETYEFYLDDGRLVDVWFTLPEGNNV